MSYDTKTDPLTQVFAAEAPAPAEPDAAAEVATLRAEVSRLASQVGVRSEGDLAALVAFFRARRGQAHAFRFRDPLDHASADTVTPLDQLLGIGDGATTRFALAKTYGDGDDAQRRRITRPDPASLRVAVAGVEQRSGWQLQELGWIAFDTPPAAGAAVTAGFLFDVPVRFATDRIDVSVAAWRAGELPSAPLVEVREV
jgi:uncharacterized protein (TIGR02217 family)